MHPRIALLPDVVINQIAAGEVVERPASVVKELVENSIDAGARQIDVDIEQGGSRLIRVSDDGYGVPRDELALALSRHATSKLREVSDLNALSTLGFRGEALPSIAAVARLTLTSCIAEADGAWRVAMHGGGELDGPNPAAHPRGTTVEVRDLFFSVPARRRFLKSERTEFLQIHDGLRRTALAAAGIGLRLTHNGQQMLSVKAAASDAGLRQRIEKICGAAFVRQAVFLDEGVPGLRVWGWLLPAEFARNQSDLQFWTVNGRPVRDNRLQHATRLAYEDTLAPGRHPAFVLHLEIDPAVLDVNVHPAKTEVRFVDGRGVHDFIFSALRRVVRTSLAVDAPCTHAGAENLQRTPVVLGEPAPVYDLSDQGQHGLSTNSGVAAVQGGWAGKVSMVLPGGYIVSRAGAAILIFDAAAAQMLMLEAMDKVAMRPLMFPQTLPVDAATVSRLELHQPELNSCGFELEAAGPMQVMIRAVPELLSHAPAPVVVEAALQALCPPLVNLRARILQAATEAAAYLPETMNDATNLLRRLEQQFDLATIERQRIARSFDHTDLRRLLQRD